MLASVFISGGVDTLRNPEPRAPAAEPVARPIVQWVPYLPKDPVQLVRLNAGAQVGAGLLLALGRFPRLAALVLAVSTVPTTAAAHRFWEVDDPAQRAQQRNQFFKNVGLCGGLLLAVVDTEGNPSLAWRARQAARTSRRAVRTGKREARLALKAARS